MSEFVKQAADYSSQSLNWLEGFQSQQADAWNKVVFPHRKTEHWKYTNLRVLETGSYFDQAPSKAELDESVTSQLCVEGLQSFDVVFVNGYYDASLSSSCDLPKGVKLVRFDEVGASVDEIGVNDGADIISQVGSLVEGSSHIFATLNAAQLENGVYIEVEPNKKVDMALRVVHVTTAQEQGATISPRVFCKVSTGAEVTLVEHFVSDDQAQNVFVNAVSEFDVQDNAKLEHYRLHLEDESSLHIGGVHARLAAHSNYDSFHLALGGKLKRIDCVVHHAGKGAHCEMNGVYVPRHKQHVDYHTCIEHAVPHCTTNEVFRGIVGDEARAVFNGRIHIHKDAQKTFAQLSNKNLLTSNKAEVDTKPELEIYADDVQCAHGATVAQLNDMSMHYLRTRGVSEKEARMMLSFGFINELINGIKLESLANFLRPQLASLFSREALVLDADIVDEV